MYSGNNHAGYAGNNKEEQILAGRLSDLANTCYNRNIPVFSAYLNLNEQNILHEVQKSFPPISIKTEGGYFLSERRIAVFLPDAEWQCDLPIKLLKISPADKRFLNTLTHRDYLGALMNLGIERSLLGDIVISDNSAYVFCLDRIASFIIDNLTKVRNDFVRCDICDELPYDFEPSYKEITGSVASLRLDAVISLAFNESRSHSTGYIENALVFVNGRLITTNAYNLKDGDIVSVRGHGRFRYMYTKSETKKGRYMVVLNLYI
ncbi:MAG: RNA-binding protein [Lachnospiraceae bacterium]